MAVNERQDDCGVQLPHVEIRLQQFGQRRRWPRFPTSFTRAGSRASLSLPSTPTGSPIIRVCLYSSRQSCLLRHDAGSPTVRQRRCSGNACYDAMIASRVERRNSALSDALRQVSNTVVGNWSWLYNTTSTFRQGVKAGTDAKARLRPRLRPNWAGPCEILAAGPCPSSDTPDGSSLGYELLCLGLPTDIPGTYAHRCVSVERCKPCANSHDRGHLSKYLPDGLTQYVLNIFTKKRLPKPRHSGRRVGAPPAARGGKDYRPSIGRWSRLGHHGNVRGALDRALSRIMDTGDGPAALTTTIVLYWAGTPNQHRQSNHLYRQTSVGATQRELSRANGERFFGTR